MPRLDAIAPLVADFGDYTTARSQRALTKSLDDIASAAHDPAANIFGRVVDAARAGATHGEIVGRLRDELGFGLPLTAV